MIDLTTKLSGIILRKAELDNNFEVIYSRVFERMAQLGEFGEEFILVLGDVGG